MNKSKFVVTGVLVNGRRFSPIRTSNPMIADSINLYRGSVWEIINGKRKLIKRVWN